MERPKKLTSERVKNATFNLSPAALAQALKKSMPAQSLSSDQDIYLDAVLLNVAHTAANVMEQESRLKGELQARTLPPASSMTRVGRYESMLYDLIDKGDVDAVKSVTKPQTLTFTAHPNFSRSRELVAASKALGVALGKLPRKDQQEILKTGQLPGNQEISGLLADVQKELKIRKKRSRHWDLSEAELDELKSLAEVIEKQKTHKEIIAACHDYEKKRDKLYDKAAAHPNNSELQETTLDVIPTVMEAASEQVRIYKKRRENLEKMPEFNNLKQLEAVAVLLPEYNSWFLDGDGKRTVHAYDGEVAIPAIKRATYQEYVKLLEKLPDQFEGIDVKKEREKLSSAVSLLSVMETFATARMNAFNKLHDAYWAYQKAKEDIDLEEKYKDALKAATICSTSYNNLLNCRTHDSTHWTTTKDILMRDDATLLKNTIGAALEKTYAKNAKIEGTEAAEDLYIKLTRYGNYAVHLQRRENAKEYNEIFQYLVQNNLDIKKNLAKKLKVKEDDVLGNLDRDRNPDFYSKAIKAFSENNLDINKGALASYKRLAAKLEKNLTGEKEGQSGERVMIPLEESRELLTLDALGMFRMAHLYPEVFKGGFVIAEFAQPDTDVLREKDKTKAEVERIAKDDLLLQLAFAKSMGAPHVEIIPLHEDPSTMQYAADAQEALRKAPAVNDYMRQWIGADTPESVEKKALRYLDDKGETKLLTAYQYLQRFGYSDTELEKKKLNKIDLQNTYVLEGPHDMEACSDNNKRAGIMGSVLADQSVRDKAAAAAKLPIKVGGKNYIIVKPKYLGQGGSIARATEIPLDTGQSTWQGEHTSSFTPASLAHKCYNYMLGRLYLSEEAARGEVPSHKLKALSKQLNIGNSLGLPGSAIADADRNQLLFAINNRLEATRDDNRYNTFLEKYGEPVSNYSSRADVKGSSKKTFNSGRAIGIAGNESGIFSNIIAFGEMFTPRNNGLPINRMHKWKKNDPMMQQLITAAGLTANFVDLKEKWRRGDIEYSRQDDKVHLSKKDPDTGARATVDLEVLKKAYDENKRDYTDQRTGIIFGADDLVMAHLTDQYHRMVKGLQELHGTQDPLEFLPKEYRADIKYYADLNRRILERWQDTKGPRGNAEKGLATAVTATAKERYTEDQKLGKLALDAYYLLHESGSIYPMPTMLEHRIFKAPEAQLAMSA